MFLFKHAVLTERVNPVDDFKETDWQAITVLAKSETSREGQRDDWLMVLEGPDGFRLRLESRHFDGSRMKGLLRAFVD